jgi:hypothetical protein
MRTKDARQIRAGIIYAKQVMRHERTDKKAPSRFDDGTPWTPFNLAYWHTVGSLVQGSSAEATRDIQESQ